MSIDTYLEEAPDILVLKDHHGKGRDDQGPSENGGAKLPGHLSFSCPGVPPSHDGNDVEGGGDIEGLEEEVPQDLLGEEVLVSRDKHDGIENLCDPRNTCRGGKESVRGRRLLYDMYRVLLLTLGASVSMDGKYQDALGQDVRDVRRDAEGLWRSISFSISIAIVETSIESGLVFLSRTFQAPILTFLGRWR